jgi:uncharacterized protein
MSIAGVLTRRIFGVALVAAVVAGPSVVLAQTPSAGATAAAKELITLKGAASVFDAVIPGVIETAKNAFLRINPSLAKDLNEVAALLRAEYANKKNDMLDNLARAFTQRFTEQELKDAVAFYKTPLGKKLILEEPAAMDEGMTKAQTWANQFSEEMLSRIRVEMRKRGHNV